MSKILQTALLCASCLILAAPCIAEGAGGSLNKEYFEKMLDKVCNAGDCSQPRTPDSPEGARSLLTDSSYLLYNSARESVEKYNEPLKKMGIKGALLIPAQNVENALCQYYGYAIARHPALQKAAQELAPHGFYTVGASDGGINDYAIEKMDMLKNGILRVSSKIMDESPFKAYFGKSGCGGKQHWVLLRIIDLRPAEEEEYYKSPFD